MSIIIGLFLIWLICCIPFVMLGIPAEVSAILGVITEICVIIYLANKSNNESSHRTTPRRSTQKGSSSYSVTGDDDLDEMVMMDMMDGDLDGKFDFFDKD